MVKNFENLEKQMDSKRLVRAKAKAKELIAHMPTGDIRISQFNNQRDKK